MPFYHSFTTGPMQRYRLHFLIAMGVFLAYGALGRWLMTFPDGYQLRKGLKLLVGLGFIGWMLWLYLSNRPHRH